VFTTGDIWKDGLENTLLLEDEDMVKELCVSSLLFKLKKSGSRENSFLVEEMEKDGLENWLLFWEMAKEGLLKLSEARLKSPEVRVNSPLFDLIENEVWVKLAEVWVNSPA